LAGIARTLSRGPVIRGYEFATIFRPLVKLVIGAVAEFLRLKSQGKEEQMGWINRGGFAIASDLSFAVVYLKDGRLGIHPVDSLLRESNLAAFMGEDNRIIGACVDRIEDDRAIEKLHASVFNGGRNHAHRAMFVDAEEHAGGEQHFGPTFFGP